MANDPDAVYYYNQNKGGIGLGLVYRHYTMFRPHAVFICVKANYWQ
jgi:hypothetical protein